MIGRDFVAKPDGNGAVSGPQNRAKTRATGYDASEFSHNLAKFESQAIEQTEDQPAGQFMVCPQAFVQLAFQQFANSQHHNPDALLSMAAPDDQLSTHVIDGQRLQKPGAKKLAAQALTQTGPQSGAASGMKTALKTADRFEVQAADIATEAGIAAGKYNPEKTEKTDSVGYNQPNITITPLAINQSSTLAQTYRILDLPHVSRVQIDTIKRNSNGVLTSLELVLEPAELGRIAARISYEEGRVTLIVSAEHKRVAEELSRDSTLLLRVLGEHISGVEKMEVRIQMENHNTPTADRQSFGGFTPNHNNSQTRSNIHEDRKFAGSLIHDEAAIDGNTIAGLSNTTSTRILL